MFYVTAKRDIVKYGCSLYFTAAECESPTVVGMCVSEGCRKKRRSLDNNYYVVFYCCCCCVFVWPVLGKVTRKDTPGAILKATKVDRSARSYSVLYNPSVATVSF
jgi:hypothetical protein